MAAIGGNVCLQYDESPVGPYVEYVTMGSLVEKRGALGQWGSRLFVSTQPADEVWHVLDDVGGVDPVEYHVGPHELTVGAKPPMSSRAP